MKKFLTCILIIGLMMFSVVNVHAIPVGEGIVGDDVSTGEMIGGGTSGTTDDTTDDTIDYTIDEGTTVANSTTKYCIQCAEDGLAIPIGIPQFVSKLITLVQILVPVIIIVMGMIKYLKVVMSGEDKTTKETNASFVRSLIAGVVIFLIVSITKTVFSNIDTGSEQNVLSCVSCFIDGECGSAKKCPTRATYLCPSLGEDECAGNAECSWSEVTGCVEKIDLPDVNGGTGSGGGGGGHNMVKQ